MFSEPGGGRKNHQTKKVAIAVANRPTRRPPREALTKTAG
jgi:hypothetical protein